MTPEEFTSLVLAKVSDPKGTYPVATYDPDGDCIEFIAKNESFCAERIDSLVTVYYGEESGEIIGSLIKGVKRFIGEIVKRMDGFKIEVQDGRIKLEHLFTAKIWISAPGMGEPATVVYKKLREVAGETGAEANLEPCAA
jgi:hypothetical protein